MQDSGSASPHDDAHPARLTSVPTAASPSPSSAPRVTRSGAGDDREPVAHLTIGDLADRTGVSSATLRMWEQRYGFPRPHRLESGHRRYVDADVAAIGRVVSLKTSGMRLDQAIAAVQTDVAPQATSVYAYLRRRHPGLATYRLTKRTLLGLSWSIEDEFCANADQADLYGAFQHERFYEKAEPRWNELAEYARSTTVFADFAATDLDAVPARVALERGDPLRREWAIVCDAPDLPVVMTAWELPGQADVRDRERVFETMWTVDPAAVHDAARVCAHLAGTGELDLEPRRRTLPESEAVTRLFNRVVSYVDRVR